MYRKPTFTGQYLRWESFSHTKQKTNLISTLVHRALMICTKSKLNEEIKHIKNILLQWFSNFFACGPLLLLQNNSGPQQFSKQKYYKKTNTEHLFQYNIYCKLAITLSGKDVLATQHSFFCFWLCTRNCQFHVILHIKFIPRFRLDLNK